MDFSLPSTVAQWMDHYQNGVHPRDLLRRSLQRCRTLPSGVWIELTTDAKLEAQLDLLDEIAARFPDRAELLIRHPLFGVPFAVKDNIDVAGFHTTAACPAHSRLAESDAQVVTRLKAAGAVCLGKTNLDQFATGLVGTRSPYGRPCSVFSERHVSGGSSSGSAVAVAREAVAFSLGTDTAGSGRIPAAFNGIVGLKPTPGRVGNSGVLPACRSLDCVSIFAHTVDDAAFVLSLIEGEDRADGYSEVALGPAHWPRGTLRIGVPEHLEFLPGSGYDRPWAEALGQLRSAGHEVVPIDFSVLSRVAALLYEGPWIAERYAVIESLLKRDPQAVDPTVRQVIEAAERFSAVDVFRAQYELRDLARQAQSLWSSLDLLVVPTAPGHPTLDELDADPVGANAALGRYTNYVNLLGWSALAVPAGKTEQGMPFGITLIADRGYDAALSGFGRDWQAGPRCATAGAGRHDFSSKHPLSCPRALPTTRIAVVGAHLSGLPLNRQLVERGACLLERTCTAPSYRLYALAGTEPPKPGMVREPAAGRAIEVEVWEMPLAELGSFVALVPYPLAIGRIELADGQWVQGFVCDANATRDALDISHFGGWRAYRASLNTASEDVK